MAGAGVPGNPRVLPPAELTPAQWVGGDRKPRLQPYQETVSWYVRPGTVQTPRMLVCHRVGAGKTATMVQIADNYFLDRRPKVLIFPTKAVCDNFCATATLELPRAFALPRAQP